METYPIILEGELWGKLTADPKGARTVFQAECRMREELTRISVYGGGREGYLGLLTPEGGKLCLTKALSRADLRDFPDPIEFAGLSGLPDGGAQQLPEEGVPAPVPPFSGPEAPEPARDTPPCIVAAEAETEEEKRMAEEIPKAPDACPVSVSESGDRTAEAASPEPPKESPLPEPPQAPQEAPAESPREETLDWYSSPDGALVCFDGAHSRIALPLGDPRIPPDLPGEPREIDGVRYVVYRTRNGRIVRDNPRSAQE